MLKKPTSSSSPQDKDKWKDHSHMHIDRDASEQDLVIRIWFGCLLEWQCQENKLKNWKKTNCLLHNALTHRFLFLLFGKKKNKNITTTTTSGRVITKFLLAMYYYSSLTRAFCQHTQSYVHPSYVLLFSHLGFCQHTQVPHSYQVMDVLFRVAFLQHYYYYDRTLSWRSFLQETESTTRNFLMYCLLK